MEVPRHLERDLDRGLKTDFYTKINPSKAQVNTCASCCSLPLGRPGGGINPLRNLQFLFYLCAIIFKIS